MFGEQVETTVEQKQKWGVRSIQRGAFSTESEIQISLKRTRRRKKKKVTVNPVMVDFHTTFPLQHINVVFYNLKK